MTRFLLENLPNCTFAPSLCNYSPPILLEKWKYMYFGNFPRCQSILYTSGWWRLGDGRSLIFPSDASAPARLIWKISRLLLYSVHLYVCRVHGTPLFFPVLGPFSSPGLTLQFVSYEQCMGFGPIFYSLNGLSHKWQWGGGGLSKWIDLDLLLGQLDNENGVS